MTDGLSALHVWVRVREGQERDGRVFLGEREERWELMEEVIVQRLFMVGPRRRGGLPTFFGEHLTAEFSESIGGGENGRGAVEILPHMLRYEAVVHGRELGKETVLVIDLCDEQHQTQEGVALVELEDERDRDVWRKYTSRMRRIERGRFL
jgi:hypothetical protein